jgi:hypothetical protein
MACGSTARTTRRGYARSIRPVPQAGPRGSNSGHARSVLVVAPIGHRGGCRTPDASSRRKACLDELTAAWRFKVCPIEEMTQHQSPAATGGASLRMDRRAHLRFRVHEDGTVGRTARCPMRTRREGAEQSNTGTHGRSTAQRRPGRHAGQRGCGYPASQADIVSPSQVAADSRSRKRIQSSKATGGAQLSEALVSARVQVARKDRLTLPSPWSTVRVNTISLLSGVLEWLGRVGAAIPR